MRLRKKEICRAKGKLYIRVILSAPVAIDALSAYAMPVGVGRPHRIIAEIHRFPGLEEECMSDEAVVVIPFLSVSKVDVVIEVDGEPCVPFRIDLRLARILSPLNYRLKPDLCHRIACVDEKTDSKRFRLRLLRFLEGEDGKAIWRMDVADSFADGLLDDTSQDRHLISVFDGEGKPVEFKLYPFETQQADIDGVLANRSIYSLEVPYSLEYFHVVASDPKGLIADGFCSSDGRFYEAKRLQTWEFMKDACASEAEYLKWFEAHRATEASLSIQRDEALHRKDGAPLFSIVVPCFESKREFLSEMVASVIGQSYAGWELLLIDVSSESGVVKGCIDSFGDGRIRYLQLDRNLGIAGNTNYGIGQACGDWIAFLDHDDVIEHDALYRYAKAVMEEPGTDALFCDEDIFEKPGEFKRPVFKSSLNYDLLYSYNCVTHFLAVKKEALYEVGLSEDDVSGAQDYDVTLRLVAAGKAIRHIPHMLYHWRQHEGSTAADNAESKPYAQDAGRRALQRYFDLRGIPGKAEDTSHPFIYRMHYAVPIPHPFVSVIIPNKDHAEDLDRCIHSIIERSAYREFEIVVVENNSEEMATFDYYEDIQSKFEQVRVVRWDGEFNYSAIINYGVANSRGDRLLLLNNDTEVISPDFMPEMLGYLERSEVGVVGAKLYFRDGLVQHAGIEVGPFDVIVHVNQDFTRAREGYRGRATRPGNFSAVTGACQMVRRDVFEEVGGYDECFAVGFNDADFCMRAYEKGYLTVFTPYAELYHYEFTSRGRETANSHKLKRWEKERDLFHERWSSYFVEGDPFSNPNLSLKSAYYALDVE